MRKEKLLILFVITASLLIFIGWIFSIKHIFYLRTKEDKFISTLKENILKTNKIFDKTKNEIGNFLQHPVSSQETSITEQK